MANLIKPPAADVPPARNLVRFSPVIESPPGEQGPREEIKVSPTYGAPPRPDKAIVGVISLSPISQQENPDATCNPDRSRP